MQHARGLRNPNLVMGYYDGNTVTGLWNLAQHFSGEPALEPAPAQALGAEQVTIVLSTSVDSSGVASCGSFHYNEAGAKIGDYSAHTIRFSMSRGG